MVRVLCTLEVCCVYVCDCRKKALDFQILNLPLQTHTHCHPVVFFIRKQQALLVVQVENEIHMKYCYRITIHHSWWTLD